MWSDLTLTLMLACQIVCQVGDVVLVTAMNINGQWEGEVNGRRGDFPFVYIQFDDDTADPTPSQ